MATRTRASAARRPHPKVLEETVIRHALLSPGLHLAPFLHGYDQGGFCLIAIDADGSFAGFFNVTSGHGNQMLDFYSGRGSMDEQRRNLDLNDIDLFSNPASVREFTTTWWKPGLHLAPWQPRFVPGGVVLVTIAPNGQVWGVHEAPTLTTELIGEAREFLDTADGHRHTIINYAETEAIPYGEAGRLRRIELQYAADRGEYGRLIGLGAHADGAEATE